MYLIRINDLTMNIYISHFNRNISCDNIFYNKEELNAGYKLITKLLDYQLERWQGFVTTDEKMSSEVLSIFYMLYESMNVTTLVDDYVTIGGNEVKSFRLSLFDSLTMTGDFMVYAGLNADQYNDFLQNVVGKALGIESFENVPDDEYHKIKSDLKEYMNNDTIKDKLINHIMWFILIHKNLIINKEELKYDV